MRCLQEPGQGHLHCKQSESVFGFSYTNVFLSNSYHSGRKRITETAIETPNLETEMLPKSQTKQRW